MPRPLMCLLLLFIGHLVRVSQLFRLMNVSILASSEATHILHLRIHTNPESAQELCGGRLSRYACFMLVIVTKEKSET